MSKNKTTMKKGFKGLEYDKKRDDAAREILIQARVNMLIKHDFWGKIATRMRLINADAWCPTLATDGRDFYYNSQFVLSLGSIEKVIFGFAHEVLHCIYDHIPRIGDRDRALSNIAQDYVINADLIENRVGEKIDEIDIIYDRKYYGWAYEEVYNDLKQNSSQMDLDEMLERLLDDHIDPEEGGGGEGDEEDEEGRKSGVSKKKPSLSKEQKEAFKEEMRNAMIQAAQSSKGAGNLPLGIQRIIDQITAPKMDWRTLIDMKIPSLIKNDYTYRTFNKKYMQQGIIVPGMNKEEAIDVAVAVDTSGSITQKQLEEMVSEVAGIMDMFEEFTIRIWQFDTGVYGYAEFTKDNAGDLLQYPIKGGGGTDFEANWTFMKEEAIEPKLLIVFTDGEPWGSWGDEDYCDTLFIINNDWHKGIVPPFGAYAYYE